MTPSRVGESLNAALHQAFARWDDLFLLGQDIADPYGGAFGITRGLSDAQPARVLPTPLSENATMGVANGLAMTGHRVIVEIMFGDFIALAFDQILNLTTKSVAMYGMHTPVRVVIRCPVGGRRGYGPTHSQSLQKHLIGIPHLALYELSPFHDIGRLLTRLLEREEPSILFEDKVTYTERIYPGTDIDRRYRRDLLDDDNWAHLHAPGDSGRPIVMLIAPGGVGRRALAAATALSAEDDLDVHILIPSRLYPADVDPILDLLVSAESIWVAEESTAGGTWGAEVASRIHDVAWSSLRAPVGLVSSADTVIPAAPHLERDILLQVDTIVGSVRSRLPSRTIRETGTDRRVTTRERAVPVCGQPVQVPKVNSNDDSYVLAHWLVSDGNPVQARQPIAEIETSKAIQELTSNTAGVLHHAVSAGVDCRPGDIIGHITNSIDMVATTALSAAPHETTSPREIPRSQRRVAEQVTASHHEIPAAFAAVRAILDELLRVTERQSRHSGAEIGLTEVIVKTLGLLAADHPAFYSTFRPDGTYQTPDAIGVAVTVDVGTGLYLPVVTDVTARSLDQIADNLTDLRMRALRGRLTEQDFAGATIALSLNTEHGITLVQPIIPPGLTTIVSLAGLDRQPWPDDMDGLRIYNTVQIGLAHDHRYINGREATGFLIDLKHLLEQPTWLENDAWTHHGDSA